MRDDREVTDVLDGRIHGARISTRLRERQGPEAFWDDPGRALGSLRRNPLLPQERLEPAGFPPPPPDCGAGGPRLPMGAAGVGGLRPDHPVVARPRKKQEVAFYFAAVGERQR